MGLMKGWKWLIVGSHLMLGISIYEVGPFFDSHASCRSNCGKNYLGSI